MVVTTRDKLGESDQMKAKKTNFNVCLASSSDKKINKETENILLSLYNFNNFLLFSNSFSFVLVCFVYSWEHI